MKLIKIRHIKRSREFCDVYLCIPSNKHSGMANNEVELFNGNSMWLCDKHYAMFKRDMAKLLEVKNK